MRHVITMDMHLHPDEPPLDDATINRLKNIIGAQLNHPFTSWPVAIDQFFVTDIKLAERKR
jgi:hypothetical protein